MNMIKLQKNLNTAGRITGKYIAWALLALFLGTISAGPAGFIFSIMKRLFNLCSF